jgi:serine O-acetyltransferase
MEQASSSGKQQSSAATSEFIREQLWARFHRKADKLGAIRNRHPTVGNNVTIYSGATILGGETVIGDNVTIGGNVFLTDSVPANTRVSIKAPELKFREAEF